MWCVIPAAGRSTRMGELTRDRPKALLEVGGRPLLEHLLGRLTAPVTDVCIVTSPDELRALQRLGTRHGPLHLHYVVQSGPAGVADAVRQACSVVSGPFLALMGDCYYDTPLTDFVDRWQATDAHGAVLIEPADEAGGQPMGLVRLTEGRVSEILKAPWNEATEWRVCGAYLFPESFFVVASDTPPADSGEQELEDVVTGLIARGARFAAIRYEGWRRNINTPEDLAAVEQRISRG